MGDSLGKKIQEMMQDKMVQSKVNKAIDMLKKDSTKDLEKKLSAINKDELMEKVNEFDEEKLKNIKIDKDEIKKKITQKDLDKLQKILGKDSDVIMKKVNDFLNS
ncbi:hypothetical protein [Ruminiclostridium cellulolyticum]|uniref:Membrane trafficking protein n=1 Tax=Ruminiclostridium cellulolyticum (strain ATCC 35319 / DSM 5812 / JCM 6584 / H10) TaxID=394503 RepID=B8I5S6_RUMCH|nr:hypothetical protein [Ruminiclostridium cellulolyticum]ACL74743.1 conserved hypothetical protein [Ruminiclostridium cellulolyticum H10]